MLILEVGVLTIGVSTHVTNLRLALENTRIKHIISTCWPACSRLRLNYNQFKFIYTSAYQKADLLKTDHVQVLPLL